MMNLDEFNIEKKILKTSACDFIRINLRPERLNPEARKGYDSLNFVEIQRDQSEEVDPPEDPFKCAKCGMSFDPSDWANDICDSCFYNRVRS